MAYSLSRYEQETVISFNAEEDEADIYTADPVYIRKFDKLVKENPEQFKFKEKQTLEGKVISKRYLFPKKFLSIRTKERTVNLTDEQKEAARNRLEQFNKMRSIPS